MPTLTFYISKSFYFFFLSFSCSFISFFFFLFVRFLCLFRSCFFYFFFCSFLGIFLLFFFPPFLLEQNTNNNNKNNRRKSIPGLFFFLPVCEFDRRKHKFPHRGEFSVLSFLFVFCSILSFCFCLFVCLFFVFFFFFFSKIK